LIRHPPVTVDLLGNSKAGAFPFAGLLQKMVPADAGQTFAFKANAWTSCNDRLVHIGQQAVVKATPANKAK